MELDQVVGTIEKIVSQPDSLDFDRVGIINPTKRKIESVGLCVDLTDYAMQTARNCDFDFLIVHHGRGGTVREKIKSLGISGYGVHLALDTMKEGLIDEFANAVGLESTLPLSFGYKGITVERGAVVSINKHSVKDLVDRLAGNLPKGIYPQVQALNYAEAPVGPVIAATGKSITRAFLDQVAKYLPQLFIAGKIDDGISQDEAKERKMTLVSVGDFQSHYPGIKKFGSKLEAEFTTIRSNEEGYYRRCPVVVIPNGIFG